MPGPDPLDRCYTPKALAQAIVDQLDIRPGDTVLEGAVGSGAFVEALLAAGADLWVNDLDPDAAGLRMVAPERASQADFGQWDAERPASWPVRFDWIIGNPPFKRADEHVAVAFRHARRVCFILRSTWYGAGFRADLLNIMIPQRKTLPGPRPPFRLDRKSPDPAPPLVVDWKVGVPGPASNRVLKWKDVRAPRGPP